MKSPTFFLAAGLAAMLPIACRHAPPANVAAEVNGHAITYHIAISDADVAKAYNVNKANFNLAEPQIHMAQIMVTPFPDPSIRNLKNSKAQTDKDARMKIEDIAARLKRGEDFTMLAQNY